MLVLNGQYLEGKSAEAGALREVIAHRVEEEDGHALVATATAPSYTMYVRLYGAGHVVLNDVLRRVVV